VAAEHHHIDRRISMSKTRLDWTQEADKRREGLVALRRDFHRHPELSFQEQRTAQIVAERLQAAGLQVRTVAGTGVVGVLRGDLPGKTVAWRADTDALPLTEVLEAPFASGTPGVMHACGHDGHTAIAITLAEILAARRRELPGTAVFLFQPAEEVLGGARPMIAAGVLDDPRVDEVYGLHLTTLNPVGNVQVRTGPTMASADAFTIEVKGAGGHGAMPHLSIDPITTAASILLGMQSLVAREVPAQDTAVLTVGQITSGTKGNIIPDRAVMKGTIRAFEQSVRDQLIQRLGDFVAHQAHAFRAEARLVMDGGACPAVVNHAKETDFVHRCAAAAMGEAAVDEGKRVMASDDMSLFLRERPGCYFRVGIAPTTGPARPHHAPEFEMNEDGLPVGLRVGLEIMLASLRG
jgi:amidohydrolase